MDGAARQAARARCLLPPARSRGGPGPAASSMMYMCALPRARELPPAWATAPRLATGLCPPAVVHTHTLLISPHHTAPPFRPRAGLPHLPARHRGVARAQGPAVHLRGAQGGCCARSGAHQGEAGAGGRTTPGGLVAEAGQGGATWHCTAVARAACRRWMQPWAVHAALTLRPAARCPLVCCWRRRAASRAA